MTRLAQKAFPLLFLLIVSTAFGGTLTVSGAVCSTTATQTYVDPFGITVQDETVNLYVAQDGVSVDYIDPNDGYPHNGAAIYWAVGKDVLSADKWGILVSTCETGTSISDYVSGQDARDYAGISTENYLIDLLIAPFYACSSSDGLSCDTSLGCVYDGTYNGTANYYFKDAPAAHVIFLRTWVFDAPSSASEGSTITISYPYTSAGRTSTVTLYYSYDQTNWETLASRDFAADESGTVSGQITLPRNEDYSRVYVKAHIAITDLSYNPCTTDIESAPLGIDILDASPSLSLTISPSAPTTSDSIVLTIDKTTPDPITTLEIYVDGSLVHSVDSPTFPYSYTIGTLSEGSHTIQVNATEDDGDTGSSSLTISVGTSSSTSQTFPGGYGYRIPITITDSSGSDLSGYQVKLTFDDTAPFWDNVQADLSDIMFAWSPSTNPGVPIDITEPAPSGTVCFWPKAPVNYDAWVTLNQADNTVLNEIKLTAAGDVLVDGSTVGTYSDSDYFCVTWGGGSISLTQNGTEIWTGTYTVDKIKVRAVYNSAASSTDTGVYLETSLPYWIEDYDSTLKYATIWVRVPKIPANGSTTIYMYYGNANATDAQNPDAVFDDWTRFGSNFDGYGLWKCAIWGSSGPSESTDPCVMYADHVELKDSYNHGAIYMDNPLYGDGYILEMYGTYTDLDWQQFGYARETLQSGQKWPDVLAIASVERATGASSDHFIGMIVHDDGSTYGVKYRTTLGAAFDENPHVFGVRLASDGYPRFYVDYVEYKGDYQYDAVTPRYAYITNTSNNGLNRKIYWARIRKYADPEPTATFGEEEEGTPTCPDGTIDYSLTYDDSTGRVSVYACPDTTISANGGTLYLCTPDGTCDVTLTPCTYNYIAVTQGTVCYYAKYVTTDGCVYTTDTLCVDAVDQTPPTVSISLSTGTESICYGTTAQVVVDATDNWTSPANLQVSGTIDGSAVTFTYDTDTQKWTAPAVVDIGDHTVEVTVTDEAGLSSTATYTYTVTDCEAPTVSIDSIEESPDGTTWTAYDGNVEEGDYVRVTASATDNVGVSSIEIYDGDTRVGTISGASGSVSWQVTGIGIHTITARAIDVSGLSSTTSTDINVVDSPEPYVIAEIQYTPTSVVVGDTVTFEADVTSTCGAVSSYAWDVGCDSTIDSSLSTFTYTFDTEGNYCVSLTVMTDDGCTSTDTVTIEVTSIENVSGLDVEVPDNAVVTRFWITDTTWYVTYITPYIKVCDEFSALLEDDNNHYWVAYFYLSDVNFAETQLAMGPSIPLAEYTIPDDGSIYRCVDISGPDGISEYVMTAAYQRRPCGVYGGGYAYELYLGDASPIILLIARCPLASYEDGVFKLDLPIRGFTGKVEWYVNDQLVRVDDVNFPYIDRSTTLTYEAALAPTDTVTVKAYAKDKLGNYISPAVCTYTAGIPSPTQAFNTFAGYITPTIRKLMSPEIVYVTLSGFTPGGLAVVSTVGQRYSLIPYNMEWLLALSVALAILGAWAWFRRRMA